MAAPVPILQQALETEEALDRAKSEFANAKQAVIQHLQKFSDFASFAELISSISNSAGQLVKLFETSDEYEDHKDELRSFDTLAVSFDVNVNQFARSFRTLNATSLTLFTNFREASRCLVRSSSLFSGLLAQVKELGVVGTTEAEKAFLEKHFPKVKVAPWDFNEYLS